MSLMRSMGAYSGSQAGKDLSELSQVVLRLLLACFSLSNREVGAEGMWTRGHLVATSREDTVCFSTHHVHCSLCHLPPSKLACSTSFPCHPHSSFHDHSLSTFFPSPLLSSLPLSIQYCSYGATQLQQLVSESQLGPEEVHYMFSVLATSLTQLGEDKLGGLTGAGTLGGAEQCGFESTELIV